MSRKRERGKTFTSVGSYYADSPYFDRKYDVRSMDLKDHETCVDSLSPKPFVDPNPLHLVKKREGCVRVSGHVRTAIFGSTVTTETWDSYPILRLVPHFGVDSFTPMSTYATLALERATPNQRVYNLGELVYGLREIARSIENIRDVFYQESKLNASSVGSAYLANEFGLQPLLSDLSEYITLQRSLADYARRIKRADKGGSFRGTLFTNEETINSRYWHSSWWHKHSYLVANEYKTKVWYTVKFKRTSGARPPSHLTDKTSLLGLDRGLLNAWELIPFSFLIDYFVDFGAYLSNLAAFEVKEICIMRTMEAKANVRPDGKVEANGLYYLEKNGLRFTSRQARIVSKERHVSFQPPSFLPVKFHLSAKRMRNILALAASRSRY